MHGGDYVAEVLKAQGVKFLFTLCGGHISPILVGCKHRGIRVIDVRHEATAVFAADAVARLTGVSGVAAVTAGPGVTNTMTAVKNAQLAQSPVVILGGATATALQGRGALQDIDQMALFKPHVKWAKSVRKVRDLVPVLEQAFTISKGAVPGPVFVECPVDLLYDEAVVREWYGVKSSGGRSLGERALKWYLNDHVNRLFAEADDIKFSPQINVAPPSPSSADIHKAAEKLQRAERPVLLVGSQALLEASEAAQIAAALERLGIPVYLSGMARGLLGKQHPLLMRHKRREALKEADLVILAGVPCDFRLDYGRHIRRSSYLISANRSRTDLKKNRRPQLGVLGDPGWFLRRLAEELPPERRWARWREQLRQRDETREKEISQQAAEPTELLNPLHLCREIEKVMPPNSMIVADGGDFVATASYIVSPSGPLTWLDPGVFGTLGVGAGFALGAKLCRPETEVWILFGDGSVGYSLSEFDTFVRHQIPVIAVVGNDACWMQIAREQIELLKDDVGTALRFTDYHAVVEGFGGKGFLLKDSQHIYEILQQAREAASQGHPVLVNAHLGKTAFRKGSVSM
ncbi:MAG: thiamine pyrophosphate-binding protein [candidate division KSB1 bacterium]|nr:thiamine pyrophosphate-binding protein [candidate division KSB1 bacterium]MDZ7365194.1 thiamine pyrophosphate-binding protein [candidate division KSB1 bacterium]MDZ7406964.1 thiamine pyrophosphate-binding protein [candidate division KSB1 bacterium]